MRKKEKSSALKPPLNESPPAPSELSKVQAQIKPHWPECVSIPPYPRSFSTPLSGMRFGVFYRFTREDAFPRDVRRLVEAEGD